MADPTPYVPDFSFTGYQTTNPSRPLPGPRVDDELQDIAAAIGGTVSAIKDIRRSDGALKNGIVTPEAMSAAFSVGYTLRGLWASGVLYQSGDGVLYGSDFYKSRTTHTSSGATQPNLAPAVWEYLFPASVAVVGDNSVDTAKLVDGAVTNAKVAAGAAIVDSKLVHVFPGTGGGARTLLSVLSDLPPSVKSYGAVGDGVADDTVAINRAAAASRAIYFPPGNYKLTGPVNLQSNGVAIGAGFSQVRLQRSGVWGGNTINVGFDGTAGAGSSGQFVIEGVLFEQLHPGFNQGTSSTMVDRLTSGQAHLSLYGGTLGRVMHCWFQGAQRSIDVRGTTNLLIQHNIFNGSFDSLNPNVSETVAYIRLLNTANQGICTMPEIRDNYLGGGPLVSRTYTYGTASYTLQGNGGAQYGLEIQGAEGLQVSGGYIGGQNRSSILINPNGIVTNLNFYDYFMDGAELCSFEFTSSGGGQVSNIVNIHNIGFNGQGACENIIIASNPFGTPVVSGLNFNNNIGQAHIKTPLLLMGANAVRVTNNIIGSYNFRGGYTAASPDASAGAYITGSSSEVDFDANTWGGGANGWGPTNNCAYGPYFTAQKGRVGPTERGILGLGGGGFVGGLTAGSATVYS